MKKKILVAAMALLGIAALAPAAISQPCGVGTGPTILFKFDADCFAYETNYTMPGFNSHAGSVLSVVGIISVWYAPFAPGLNASDPLKEYTFYWTGMTSAGTVATPLSGGTTVYNTEYGSGSFVIYEGTPRNAPTSAGGMPALPSALVPGNFVDGTLLLNGLIDCLHTGVTQSGTGAVSGSFRGKYHFTPGGSRYADVQNTGDGLLNGLWAAGNPPATYSAHPNGKFDSPEPLTVLPSSTWGSIKQLYR